MHSTPSWRPRVVIFAAVRSLGHLPALSEGRRRRIGCAYATSLCLALLVGCSSSTPSTSIRFSPSSLITPGWADVLRIRVFGPNGTLAFCQAFPIDETREPGSTVALFSRESTLVVAPGSESEPRGAIRIVAEAFVGATAGACDDPTKGGLVARKVSVLPYAVERSLDLRSVFELSCVGVTSCDELEETCASGRCVAADAFTSGSVNAACFDLAACPALERATPKDRCTFDLSTDARKGYVAVTFALPGESPSDVRRGASVLTFDDYEIVGERTIALLGSSCERSVNGTIDGVYFGFACDSSSIGGPLCGPIRSSTDTSPIVGLLVGQDAGATDATRASDGGADVSNDATRDAPSDAPVDATTDSGHDGSGGVSDGASDGDGSPSMPDGGGPSTSGRVECITRGTYCTPGQTECCQRSTTSSVCEAAGTLCLPKWSCDDAHDCAAGEVCCRIPRSGLAMAQCRSPAQCVEPALPVCSTDWAECPPPSTCTYAPSEPTPGHYECGIISGSGQDSVECGLTACILPLKRCCATTTPTCVGDGDSCAAGRLSCDDVSDCSASGFNACCSDGSSSACAQRPSGQCAEGFQNVCSLADPTCPIGLTCRQVLGSPFTRYECAP